LGKKGHPRKKKVARVLTPRIHGPREEASGVNCQMESLIDDMEVGYTKNEFPQGEKAKGKSICCSLTFEIEGGKKEGITLSQGGVTGGN